MDQAHEHIVRSFVELNPGRHASEVEETALTELLERPIFETATLHLSQVGGNPGIRDAENFYTHGPRADRRVEIRVGSDDGSLRRTWLAGCHLLATDDAGGIVINGDMDPRDDVLVSQAREAIRDLSIRVASTG